MILLHATLAVCAVLAALLVARYDLYDREPWYMLGLAAALGFAGMWVCSWVEPWTMGLWPGAPAPDAWLAAVAATHEEMARLAIVAGLAFFAPRQFNDPMDGIVYGSIVGLGMAIEESLHYLGAAGASDGTFLPASEPVRLAGHLVMGGITGFAVGMARMRMRRTAAALVACLSFSIGMHFAWDWIAFAAGRAGRMTWWQTAAAVALMLAGMVLYGALVTVGSDWSRRVFAPRSRATLWGWPLTLLRSGKGR